MERTLAQTRALYESFFALCPNLPDEVREKSRDLLVAAEQREDREARVQALETLNDTCLPGFCALEQGGYGCYDWGDHLHDFPGSFGHRMRLVVAALRENRQAYLGYGGYVLAVYPDYAVVCKFADDYGYGEGEYYRVPFAIDEGDNTVALGEMSAVDVLTVDVEKGVVSPLGEVEDTEVVGEETQGEETVTTQEEVTKTDNGQEFKASAYLIVPDVGEPSTWKVRVEETPGNVTVAQLGRAYAALTKGFRGNKVEASDAEISAAKKKLKGLYKKHGATWPGDKKKQDQAEVNADPEWLLQGEDPPGGEQELIQTVEATITQACKCEKTGRMKIKGTATVGNQLNRNGEVYPTQVWQDNMPRLQELVSQDALTGESDHPKSNSASLDRIAIKYTAIRMDGDEITFEGEVIPTIPAGQNLEILLENNVRVDISSRGYGRTATQEWTDPKSGQVYKKVPVVARGFRCDAFDAVVRGASQGSTIESHTTQAARDAAEEDLEMSQAAELTQQIAEIAAQVKTLSEVVLKTNGATPPAAPVETPPAPTNGDGNQQQGLLGGGVTTDTLARMEQMFIQQRKREMLEEAKLKWSQPWVNTFRNHLDKIEAKTISELEAKVEQVVSIIQTGFDQAPPFPGNGFTVKQDVGNRPGPKTPNEMIDFLVRDLPDGPSSGGAATDAESGVEGITIPNWLNSPRQQCKRVLQNMAQLELEGFNGPLSLQTLVKFHQGYDKRELDRDWMNQACADGTTSVAANGAPATCVFIFPLVTRVWPLLIANEIASIQPMDRPDGKIFFLDFLRIVTGASFTDEGGNLVSDRVRADNSSLFSSSYSNKAAECDTSVQLQLRIASKNVTATTKQIHSNWTQEEVQDLRAYHNLDAASLLLEGQSKQVALEWNLTILNAMLAAAGAGNRNYGTVAPTGFNQEEWERYITRYLDASSIDIMTKRNAGMTHIVMGPAAGLRVAALNRWAVTPVAVPNPEMFPGLVLTPWTGMGTGSVVKAYISTFWTNQNSDKILVIRRGPEWSDTPYVWAPYADYVSPVLTTPSTMTHQRGIMSRAAHTSVVPEAMGTVTIQTGVTGVPL